MECVLSSGLAEEMCFHREFARGVLCNQVRGLAVLEKWLNISVPKKNGQKVMGHGVQPPSPLQFTLVSRYCRVSGIISDPILTPRSKRSPLFCCDCISSLVGHILIWREQFREVRSEVYNNEVNSSGKILAGTNIIFPGAILPVLQPGLCCQGDTALLALAHSKQL